MARVRVHYRSVRSGSTSLTISSNASPLVTMVPQVQLLALDHPADTKCSLTRNRRGRRLLNRARFRAGCGAFESGSFSPQWLGGLDTTPPAYPPCPRGWVRDFLLL